jgi:hypothetical protein
MRRRPSLELLAASQQGYLTVKFTIKPRPKSDGFNVELETSAFPIGYRKVSEEVYFAKLRLAPETFCNGLQICKLTMDAMPKR